MIRSAARHDNNAIDRTQTFFHCAESPEFGHSLFEDKPPAQSIRETFRLLENFLEHEMRVAAVFGNCFIPLERQFLFFPFPTGERLHHIPVTSNDCDLIVVEVYDALHIPHQGRHIGRDKHFSASDTEYQWAAQTRSQHYFWILSRDGDDTIRAFQLPERFYKRLFKGKLFHLLFKEMSNNLCICLGTKLMSSLLENIFEPAIIFNDAVVHHRYIAATISMRVSVPLRWLAMRRPARVRDPNSGHKNPLHFHLECRHLA